jgi:hypothetical protein
VKKPPLVKNKEIKIALVNTLNKKNSLAAAAIKFKRKKGLL